MPQYDLDETKKPKPKPKPRPKPKPKPDHHHGHHHHGHHSGDKQNASELPPWTMIPSAPQQPQFDIGTVEHAVAVCYAALSALPLRYSRNVALGMILSKLCHTEKLLGLNDMLQQAMQRMNHYGADIE